METAILNYLIFAGQILLALFLGGILGWQREHIGKSAGPRTYGLVAAGAALFTMMSLYGFANGEPTRVAAQILTGIGFLGAGIIIHKDGGTIEGLTTAAGLWAVSAIGMAVGIGWYGEAIIFTFLLLVVLMFNDNKWTKGKRR
ncbi:MAG: MgtC/SapB family protein [Candidatus Magasanikbacteria bacterium]|jgi:putative Mg2+ transporter-C (MgtC) family protein|nr:MgtC/SapB family protein [Candidatus Magasanikbacteria bacterium]MBT4315209.1 MgtC/SapB family protein [Candidatus Magasanikbacteria bacterium]MBT4547249.1 MgtC/SapB family protein [Candidatus Magasanikbacteria bacterium]MBT6819016.1 MgtC/SapB family protein [Candidatus Magasanikbacteria bacterium]